MLKPDFISYSEGSRTLADFDHADAGHDCFDAADGARLLIAECERTAAAILAAAPGRIARGTLTREDADRQAAIFRAIAADLKAERAHLAKIRGHFAAGRAVRDLPLLPDYAAASGFTWEDKLHVLRREIHMRRRYDPDRVDKGRLAPADAVARLERLEAVQDKYWRCLFAWTSPSGAEPGSAAWMAEVREHGRLIELSSSADADAGKVEGSDQLQEALPV